MSGVLWVSRKELQEVAAVRPKVTVSSCLCDQTEVQAVIRQEFRGRRPIRGEMGGAS